MRKAISLLIILVCTVDAMAQQQVRRDFQKTVTMAGRPFRIEHSFGNLNIRTQPGRDALIRAALQCSADRAADAQRICDQIQILVREERGVVMLQTEFPNEQRSGNRGFRVDYEITIPDNTPLDMRNRFGNVTLADLLAPVTINNTSGMVRILGGRGTRDIENTFGNVEVKTQTGDLRIRNTSGDVNVGDIIGMADIHNRFGKIIVNNVSMGLTVEGASGSVDAQTLGGPVSIINSFGPVNVSGAKTNVTVRNQSGPVKVIDVLGSAELQTSFNSLNFSRIAGDVLARAESSAVTGDNVNGNATVETTFGGATLEAIKGAVNIRAASSALRLRAIEGRINAKTTFQGAVVEDAAGPVQVENQSGSVTVGLRSGRCQPVTVNTSFAPMRVIIPNGGGYNFDARTTFGLVTTNLELQNPNRNTFATGGRVQDSSIAGRVPGTGNCELRLTNQSGNIDVVKGTR